MKDEEEAERKVRIVFGQKYLINIHLHIHIHAHIHIHLHTPLHIHYECACLIEAIGDSTLRSVRKKLAATNPEKDMRRYVEKKLLR